MLGETLSVITSFLWATSTVLVAKALKDIDPISVNALKTFFSSISMLPIAFLMGEIQNIYNLDFYSLVLVILAAIIGFGIGDTIFFKSINLIGVSRSYTIAYIYPLITIVLATMFLGEPFLLRYLLGAVIIFFGVIMVSVNNKSKEMKEGLKGQLTAFITAIFWSIALILLTLGLKNFSVILANAIRFPFLLFFLLLASLLRRRTNKKSFLSKRNLIFLASSGILGMTIGGIIFLYSIQLIGVSRATPLSSTSPIWASLMSGIFLKEKVTWRAVTSSLMVVIGIYFLT